MATTIRFILASMLWAAVLYVFVVAIRGTLFQGGCERNSSKKLFITLGAILTVAVMVGLFFLRSIPYSVIQHLGADSILGMDLNRVIDTLTASWQGNYRTRVHPLQCLLFQPVGYVLQGIGKLSKFRASQVISVTMLSFSSVALVAVLWRYTKSILFTMAGGILYLLSFAFMLNSTLPESGGLASWTVILPYLLYAAFSGNTLTRREILFHLIVAIFALSVTTTNVVHSLIVFALRCLDCETRKRIVLYRVLGFVAMVFIAGAMLSVIQKHLYPGADVWFLPRSIREEQGYLRYDVLSLRHFLGTTVQLFAYTLVGPRLKITDLLIREGELKPYFSAEIHPISEISAMTLVLVLSTLALFCVFIAYVRKERFLLAAGLGLGFNLFLHLTYGRDPLMYSGNWAVLLCAALTISISKLRSKAASILFVSLLPLILVNNLWAFNSLYGLLKHHSVLPGIHTMSGVPGSDELKRVFVDYTGGYSPGVGTCGVRFAIWDAASKESSLSNIVLKKEVEGRLEAEWIPFPVIRSKAGELLMEQRLRVSPANEVMTRIAVNSSNRMTVQSYRFYIIVTTRGAAGTDSRRLYDWDPIRRAVLIDGAPTLYCEKAPDSVAITQEPEAFKAILVGKSQPDEEESPHLKKLIRRIKNILLRKDKGSLPKPRNAILLTWEGRLEQGEEKVFWFRSPIVLSFGEGSSPPVSAPDPKAYHPSTVPVKNIDGKISKKDFEASKDHWVDRLGQIRLLVPDERWSSGFYAGVAQLALCVGEKGRIVVSPVNYGPFTRDAVYMIYGLLISGQWDLAKESIEYLLSHPWSGREWAEGDAIGQLLWIMGKYYSFTQDRVWLSQKVSRVKEIVLALKETRTNGHNKDVSINLLGQTRLLRLSPSIPKLRAASGVAELPNLNYGTMDGDGLLYVNFFSLAGLNNALMMAKVSNERNLAQDFQTELMDYNREFKKLLRLVNGNLAWDNRGHANALWPCGYHEIDKDPQNFYENPKRSWNKAETIWPYLDMDAAHNYMIAGHREAGWQTLNRYFDGFSFRMWKTLNEGGPSIKGYWPKLSTNPPWQPTIAMPHGWSIASLVALIRNSLVLESDGSCILLSGVPPEWFHSENNIQFTLPTEFGLLKFQMLSTTEQLRFSIGNDCNPPNGFVIRLPQGFEKKELRISTAQLRQNEWLIINK